MVKLFTHGLLLLALISICMAEGLDGVSGKLFDVKPDKKEARFLKQDVTYDPETGESKAWYTVRWSDSTIFTKKTRQPTYAGIAGPIVAQFRGINEKNAAALKAGKPFRARSVFLFPGRKDVTGISADGSEVVGWFTPIQKGRFPNGLLKVGDQEISASLLSGGARIVIMETVTPADLTKGFWKTTLKGTEADGTFVVESMLLDPLVDPLAVDDPKLPRVLSVGDSISINYMNSTKAALKGIANYHRIEDNCWSTRRGKAFMPYWLGDYTRKGLGWDVILFNSGMHDLKQNVLGGHYSVPVDEYKMNLRKEIEIMKTTGAKLIFVTTTPVPNDGGSEHYAFRSKGSEKDFNNAARELLRDFPEVQILDLAKVVHESPVMDKWRTGTDVHYWKETEQAVLGKAVADAIKSTLK